MVRPRRPSTITLSQLLNELFSADAKAGYLDELFAQTPPSSPILASASPPPLTPPSPADVPSANDPDNEPLLRWRRRFAVASHSVLYLFSDDSPHSRPARTVSLDPATTVAKGHNKDLMVFSREGECVLQAPNAVEQGSWIDTLRAMARGAGSAASPTPAAAFAGGAGKTFDISPAPQVKILATLPPMLNRSNTVTSRRPSTPAAPAPAPSAPAPPQLFIPSRPAPLLPMLDVVPFSPLLAHLGSGACTPSAVPSAVPTADIISAAYHDAWAMGAYANTAPPSPRTRRPSAASTASSFSSLPSAAPTPVPISPSAWRIPQDALSTTATAAIRTASPTAAPSPTRFTPEPSDAPSYFFHPTQPLQASLSRRPELISVAPRSSAAAAPPLPHLPRPSVDLGVVPPAGSPRRGSEPAIRAPRIADPLPVERHLTLPTSTATATTTRRQVTFVEQQAKPVMEDNIFRGSAGKSLDLPKLGGVAPTKKKYRFKFW
ncbi:hypothetical protein HDU96_002413 [Phlyctochytrium bullatum]|nr:hypothetical protein HDU96_002413 [Phlyctochytrium bullatum]